MIKFAAIVVFSLFHLATFAVTAGGGEAPSATPYSGDIWTRSILTGDWGGLRNQLAEKGVTLDLSVTQSGQGVVNGGKSGAWQYGGRGDIILNLDSQKLGLWPGAFLNLEAEGNWASAVNANTGALMPVNNSQILIPILIEIAGDNSHGIALRWNTALELECAGLCQERIVGNK